MKKRFCAVLLVLGLCFAVAGQDRAAWSAEQRDAWNSFNDYLQAVQQGNTKAMLAFWHPKYVKIALVCQEETDGRKIL